MPSLTLPYAEPYNPAPPPTEELDYVDLPVLDFSKTSTPKGWATLAEIAKNAMATQGFLTVINHGYTAAQTKRMFDIANIPFDHVPPEEKGRYVSNMKETGSYQGYKLPQLFHIENGVYDRKEQYSINFDVEKRSHPEALRPFLPEIEAFGKFCHFHIVHPILKLLAQGLQLPEETFVDMHDYNAVGESSIRFIKYYTRPEEEEIKTKNVWLKGHTDIGSVSVLFSQPVAGLQILSPEGHWQWARYVPNGLVINIGDMLQFLSNGFYKATVHRVVQPPPSQGGLARLGLFFFSMPDDSIVLRPVQGSPVLEKMRKEKIPSHEDNEGENAAPTAEMWRKARTASYGFVDLKKEGNVETEVINGIVVKHYN
ncbi:Clavaminate synthase-like protein [Heliocybe sulcata]|uniref:Clavaminate synthase-like protein n=1 Tax=Heliocybe sulcata TaxID=5364 RepID=A0A5C3N521_9AGAM|nr:Clavaminate synthase-like protein [Heliocybe sulcata]